MGQIVLLKNSENYSKDGNALEISEAISMANLKQVNITNHNVRDIHCVVVVHTHNYQHTTGHNWFLPVQ